VGVEDEVGVTVGVRVVVGDEVSVAVDVGVAVGSEVAVGGATVLVRVGVGLDVDEGGIIVWVRVGATVAVAGAGVEDAGSGVAELITGNGDVVGFGEAVERTAGEGVSGGSVSVGTSVSSGTAVCAGTSVAVSRLLPATSVPAVVPVASAITDTASVGEGETPAVDDADCATIRITANASANTRTLAAPIATRISLP
jgi:hypothetical protein